MRKSNVIILAVLAVAAGFFLWLWYYLGFNFVDDPFDLVLAVVWWAVVVALVVGIHAAERKRQRPLQGQGRTLRPSRGIAPPASLPAKCKKAGAPSNEGAPAVRTEEALR